MNRILHFIFAVFFHLNFIFITKLVHFCVAFFPNLWNYASYFNEIFIKNHKTGIYRNAELSRRHFKLKFNVWHKIFVAFTQNLSVCLCEWLSHITQAYAFTTHTRRQLYDEQKISFSFIIQMLIFFFFFYCILVAT